MAYYTIDNKPFVIDFTGGGGIDRILKNCKNLIMTRRGEIPYDRLRGLDDKLFHMPLGQVRQELVPALDIALSWEPRATVVSADANIDENGELIITMIVEV